VLFAKNSDRERNEAQGLDMSPRRHGGGPLKLTYITIPDAQATHACLLSQPCWMWGAEMGANEHGVAIGNEALHAKTPAQRKPALTGMDLVRLGLERAATAAEAVSVITGLLERYGQGGNCGHLGRFYYDNGFIIADPHEAFVLETAGRWWAVERVKRHRALSNAYSIGRGYDAVSADLADHAREQRWVGGLTGRFDVAKELLDEARDAVSFGRGRCARGNALLDRGAPKLTPQGMMAILRDHGDDPDWSPANTRGRTICMHAAQGPRRSQSVGSMVSELRPGRTVHWVTGTSAPCISIFKPVVFEAGRPPLGSAPNDWFDYDSAWWRHERLHRALLRDFTAGLAAIAGERDSIEAALIAHMDAAFEGGPEALHRAVADCWREAEAAEMRWLNALEPSVRAPHSAHRRSWARLNQVAGLPRT
jgi:dipeptidase